MTMTAKWHGAEAKAKAKRGAARGVALWAEHVLEQSRRVVPVVEGTLRGSATASVDEGALRAAVSYDTVYACRQHEEMGYQHSAGKTAKYLEVPFNASQKVGPAIVAREIKKGL
jgi:hypothetical protein